MTDLKISKVWLRYDPVVIPVWRFVCPQDGPRRHKKTKLETAPGNERLEIEISTQQAEMQKVEREMRLMRERLPPDNQEALEMALAEVVGSQGAAFSRLLPLASEHHLHNFAIYKSFICIYI